MARKAISNDRYRLVGTYERLRKNLVDRPDDGRLDKALSYWVLPTDRRLPIAFLDRPLRDLLSQPFDELMATPGVGHKKILGFFDLLKRAAKASAPDAPFGLSEPGHGTETTKDDPDRRLRCLDRFRIVMVAMVRNRSSLRPRPRKAGPLGALAAIVADRHLAFATGRIRRSVAGRYSLAQDARRKARSTRFSKSSAPFTKRCPRPRCKRTSTSCSCRGSFRRSRAG